MSLQSSRGYAKCFTSMISVNPTLLDKDDNDNSNGSIDDDHDNIHFTGEDLG